MNKDDPAVKVALHLLAEIHRDATEEFVDQLAAHVRKVYAVDRDREIALHKAVRDTLIETNFSYRPSNQEPIVEINNKHGIAHRNLRNMVASMEPSFSDEIFKVFGAEHVSKI